MQEYCLKLQGTWGKAAKSHASQRKDRIGTIDNKDSNMTTKASLALLHTDERNSWVEYMTSATEVLWNILRWTKQNIEHHFIGSASIRVEWFGPIHRDKSAKFHNLWVTEKNVLYPHFCSPQDVVLLGYVGVLQRLYRWLVVSCDDKLRNGRSCP